MRAWATAGRLVGMGREATGGSTLAQRVLKRIGMACTVASTVGAVDVFLLLWLVLPPPHEAAAHFPEAEIANAVAFAIFLPLTLAIGWAWGYRLGRPWRRFLDEGREATESERIATLRYRCDRRRWGAPMGDRRAAFRRGQPSLLGRGRPPRRLDDRPGRPRHVRADLPAHRAADAAGHRPRARRRCPAAPVWTRRPGPADARLGVCHGSAAARSRLPRDSCPYRGRVARASGGERPRAERRRGDGRPARNRACRTLGRRAARLPP